MARIDEEGPNALLRLRAPVNKFPDLVRYIVQRLKVVCPRLGKAKIAEMLCRAGLHLAPTTVGRMLWHEPVLPGPIAAMVAPVVRADRSNHVWHIDLTAVPTRLGFWVPWRPGALPQEWPFSWWVVVVLDHFSRRVQGFQVFAQKPDARALCAFLSRTVRAVGATPRHLISDQESMFTSDGVRGWCKRRGIRGRDAKSRSTSSGTTPTVPTAHSAFGPRMRSTEVCRRHARSPASNFDPDGRLNRNVLRRKHRWTATVLTRPALR